MKKHLLSPIGEADYPHLDTPDRQFDPKGKYGVSLVLDPKIPEQAEYLKQIEELARTKVGAGASVPIRDHKDSDGNPTGEKVVKFTSSFAPKVYDKFNKPLENKMVGRGSVIQVAAVPNAYKNVAGHSGINLYLVAVSVRELVEPTGSGAEGFGFVPEAAEEAVAKTAEEIALETPKPFFVESDELPF